MKKGAWLLLTTVICFNSCGQSASGVSAVEDLKAQHPPWLEMAYESAQNADNIRSLLVNHQGSLVAEEYFDRYSSDSLDHVRSVTKSVVATLVGIAIDKGIIGGVNESISDYLGEAAKGKEDITIKHLLSMTSGIEWSEGASGYNAWITSGDHVNYVLNKPMSYAPGAVWNYNSAGVHLLSVILTKASGMSTLEFAQKHLFSLIDIKNVRWEQIRDGFYNGGAGLELRPKDMIKFGQLYANGGVYYGKRVVSERFIKEATSFQQPKDMVLDENEGYGYCWWLAKPNNIVTYAALGYGGQTIIVFPDLNTVMTATHHWRVNSTKATQQQDKSVKTLGLEVLEGLLKK